MPQTRLWLLTNMTHDDYDMPCPPFVTTLDSIQYGVCDAPPTLPLLPPYFNARVNLLLDPTWAAARSLFFSLSSCPFRRCPMMAQ